MQSGQSLQTQRGGRVWGQTCVLRCESLLLPLLANLHLGLLQLLRVERLSLRQKLLPLLLQLHEVDIYQGSQKNK